MTIHIDEKEKAIHALRMAIKYTNDRLVSGFTTCHPDRRDIVWYSNVEDDIDVAKTLTTILNKLEYGGKEGGRE